MLRYAAIYGAIAGTVIIAILATVLTIGGADAFTSSTAFGYLVMLVILSLIFLGVKRYRDVERGGIIGFVPAFGLGLGIAAIASVFYVISWEGVLAATDFEFIDQYREMLARQAEALPANEKAAKLAEAAEFDAMYRDPLIRLPMTFVEIFPVGLIVALVSAALLRNPRLLPARTAA